MREEDLDTDFTHYELLIYVLSYDFSKAFGWLEQ